MNADWSANIHRFTGFADLYDRHRAGPPTSLAPLLARYAGTQRPSLVVDLGSGTGLSSRYWADKAGHVVGIEPAPDMRGQAAQATLAPNVRYAEGFSHQTGLPDGCADIVVCMQALHWMEPEATFREAARILRPGGVFAACDYDWPPSVGSAELEACFEACAETARVHERRLGLSTQLRQWDKTRHLARMQRSGCFGFTREVFLTHADEGNAARFIGILLSQGYVQQVLKAGIGETELGLVELRRLAAKELSGGMRPWQWSARVRLGIVGTVDPREMHTD